MSNGRRGTRGWIAVLAAALMGGCASAPEQTASNEDLVFPAPPDPARFYYERTLYSSADVTEADKNSKLRSLLTGAAASTGEGVAKPYGVAARRGRLYVADSVGGNVKVFDIPGRRFYNLGEDGAGQLFHPLGVDVDAAGNAFVVDSRAKVVKMYDPEGKFLRQFGGTEMFARPVGVGVDPKGARIFVVDAGGVQKQKEHRVRAFEVKTGKHLFDFGTRGTGDGQFNLPRDVAVAPDGTVYVVDAGNFRVQAFAPDGTFLRAFGKVGRNPGQFARPREIAVDPEGRVYVSDAAFGNFQIFSPKGELLLFIGTRSERDRPARYMLPAGIAVDLDGRVYMADQYFRKIDVYRPAALKAEEGFIARAPDAQPERAKKN